MLRSGSCRAPAARPAGAAVVRVAQEPHARRTRLGPARRRRGRPTPLPPRAARRSISASRSALSGTGPPAARSASRCSISRRSAGRSAARRRGLDGRRLTARPGTLERLVHGALDDLLLVPAAAAAVARMFDSAAGWISRSAGITSSRRRLRAKERSSLDSSSRHGSPAATAVGARVGAGHLQQRPHDAVPARRHAEQGAAAGRRDQPVEDGLDLVGGGVAGGHEVQPLAQPDRLGGRVARLPCRASRLPRGLDCTRSTCSRTPSRSQSSRQNCSSSSAAGRSPWFTCRPPAGRARAPRASACTRHTESAPPDSSASTRAAGAARQARSTRSHGRSPRWTYLVFNARVGIRARGWEADRAINAQCPRHRQPASPCVPALAGRVAAVRLCRARRIRRRAQRRRGRRHRGGPGELIVGFTPPPPSGRRSGPSEGPRRGRRPDRVDRRGDRDGRPRQGRGRHRAPRSATPRWTSSSRTTCCGPAGSRTTAASGSSGACATSGTSTARPAPTSRPPPPGT